MIFASFASLFNASVTIDSKFQPDDDRVGDGAAQVGADRNCCSVFAAIWVVIFAFSPALPLT
jgi:hypothetical protein